MAKVNIDGTVFRLGSDFDHMDAEGQANVIRGLRKQLQAQPSPPGVLEDTARGAIAGVGQAVTGIPGMPGEMEHAGREILYKLGQGAGVTTPEQAAADRAQYEHDRVLPTAGETTAAAGRAVPAIAPYLNYEPRTVAGRYGRAAGRGAASMMMGPGATVPKLVAGAAGGLAGEAADQALQNTSFESWGPWAGVVAALATGGGAYAGTQRVLTNRGLSDPAALRKILGELQASGMTPQQAEARIQQLGPEAFLADVNPGMQVAAGGVSAAGPAGASVMSERLGQRMEQAPDRVSRDLTRGFGPPADPFGVREANQTQRAAISPMHEQAVTNAPPLPQAVHDTLAAQLTNPAASLSKRNFMLGIMNQVDDALAADTPELVARRLHDLRKNLDAQIVYDPRQSFMLSSADKANQGALKEARAAIDDVLKNRIPGFQEADEAFAPAAREFDAYEKGRTQTLTRAVSPEEHAADFRDYTAAERAMSRAGQRQYLHTELSNARQNPGYKAERLLTQNLNAPKVRTSIGQQRAEQLARALDREETFTGTSNLADVSRGSRTAMVDAANKRMFGGGGGLTRDVASGAVSGLPFGLQGMFGGGVAGLVGNLSRRVRQGGGASDNAIRQVAERMTATGAERDTLMRELQTLNDRVALPPSMLERTARALLMFHSTGR